MGEFLVLVGLGGIIFGIVNLVNPLGRLRIETRGQAGAVVAGSFVVMLIGGVLLPPNETDPEGVATSTTVLVSTTGVAPPASSTAPTTTMASTTTLAPATTTSRVASTTTLAPTTTTTALTVDQQVEAAVREVVGDDHFISTVVTEVDPNSYVAAIVFEGSENLTLNLTATGICLDVSRTFRGVFDFGYDIQLVTIEVMYPFIDQFGNIELNRAVLARLEGETYSKINQDTDDATLDLDIIPGLTDWAFVHPGFAETNHFADVLS